MIVLSSTTDKIQVVLGASHTANPVRLFASYRDITSTTYLPSRNVLNSNGTTAVDIVGSPSASTQRVVDFISAHNADTITHTITIRFNDNGTTYELFKALVGAGEKVEYHEGRGFRVLNSVGAEKQITTGVANTAQTGMSVNVLASDVTNNNGTANTIADVTGLSFPVVTGNTYYFKFTILYTAAATATGSRWAVNGPAFSLLGGFIRLGLSTAGTVGTDGVTDIPFTAYDSPTSCNATSSSTSGNLATIEGVIKPTADGNVIARFASEVASSAIVAKAGSFVEYRQI